MSTSGVASTLCALHWLENVHSFTSWRCSTELHWRLCKTSLSVHCPSKVKVGCECTMKWQFSSPAQTPSGISVEPHHEGYMSAQDRKAKTHISRLPRAVARQSTTEDGVCCSKNPVNWPPSWIWSVWEIFQDLKLGGFYLPCSLIPIATWSTSWDVSAAVRSAGWHSSLLRQAGACVRVYKCAVSVLASPWWAMTSGVTYNLEQASHLYKMCFELFASET